MREFRIHVTDIDYCVRIDGGEIDDALGGGDGGGQKMLLKQKS